MSEKKSLLVICEILGLFFDTLPADEKDSLLNRDILTQPIQLQLSKNEKKISEFFSALFKSRWNFEHFEKKKMTHIPYVFPKLQTAKDVVRQMSEKSRFKRLFDKRDGKPFQTQFKSARPNLYHLYWSLWRKLSWKKPPLVICKILRHFVNTLTADGKYFLLNNDNLTQPITMQLSKKQ